MDFIDFQRKHLFDFQKNIRILKIELGIFENQIGIVKSYQGILEKYLGVFSKKSIQSL